MNSRPTWGQRLRYAFDNMMSRGTPALIFWLAAATFALIIVFTIIFVIFGLSPEGGDPHKGVIGEAYYTLLHALDPGTITADNGNWVFLLLMFLVTLGGLLIFSALIGVLSTGLDSRLQDLRKGRSLVLEEKHTLILGWGKPVFTILSELDIANEGEHDPVVVILSETDKVLMDDTLRERSELKNLRVVTRHGSPIDVDDLALVRPELASATIVLPPIEEPEPDAYVIKVILALTQLLKGQSVERGIVAEIADPANLSPARLAGAGQAVLLDGRETIAKLLVQAARQSGVSVAVQELLDFDGHEIYIEDASGFIGIEFAELLGRLEVCSVIGLLDAEGTVTLNPPGSTVVAAGDRMIAIAEDDTVLELLEDSVARPDFEQILAADEKSPDPERVVVLGWNKGAQSVITHFDAFLAPGSEIHVVVDPEIRGAPAENQHQRLGNTDVTFRHGSTTDRSTLEDLELGRADHVMVLACSDDLDAQRADARTLVTLLHLREINENLEREFSIVTEMVDERSRRLAEVAEVDDVIVSENVISLLFSQISQNHHLADVFTQLFSPEGSEIYLRPAETYVAAKEEVSFATMVEAARRRGECAIGYREAGRSRDPESDFGMVINPPKSRIFKIDEGDSLVVLAED